MWFLQISDILATFGAFMAVLFAIEIFVNTVSHLREDVIHVHVVLATAMMAIARKVIILDCSPVSSWRCLRSSPSGHRSLDGTEDLPEPGASIAAVTPAPVVSTRDEHKEHQTEAAGEARRRAQRAAVTRWRVLLRRRRAGTRAVRVGRRLFRHVAEDGGVVDGGLL